MQKEWLKKKITVSEAEAAHMLTDPRLGPSPVPFGFQNARWRAFVAKMQDADELWTFSSGGESWQHLCGRAGISLVRNGEIIDSIVTLMN
jgi:hypothetical protein